MDDDSYEKTFASLFYDQYGLASKEEVYSLIPKENVDIVINGMVLRQKAQDIIWNSAEIEEK